MILSDKAFAENNKPNKVATTVRFILMVTQMIIARICYLILK
ncbi:hypothetical protein MOVI109754_04610 [Moritella viscosa]|uniref:Uncharacterized protein n=1 Tax=Moritella viscosa TaxID=80854 RepID=A0A1L0APB3_9GAMM|nr:Protein of unknown function (DUF3753) [Moritella viscosa]SGY87605.1 Protein of unknown function (DUF3753) [Moritella viscosa]SGY89276.1 Protein of unknown function (DUF3753) [Moritella viscosa]SGY89750.1 Protein of unknown function (DUF3753) [Moritella viscosa]SHO00609.1 Protein of unknown function (DUF3753) [Moritella viscosa]